MEENYRNKFCILGIPDHLGVMHVGGRLGAALGPEAFRKLFSKYEAHFGDSIVIAGDVKGMGGSVATNHDLAARAIAELGLARKTVIVGGGHDHGYSHLLGVSKGRSSQKKTTLGCINIDAHFDLRKPNPEITSGSPFYLAVESGLLNPKNFIEFGIQPQSNGQEVTAYAQAKKIKTVLFAGLRFQRAVSQFRKCLSALASKVDEVVISLDLDAIAQAYAPGVSAPQSEGFTPSEIFQMMSLVGSHKKVRSLGIFELNPLHDRDDATARLAATAAFYFLKG